MAAPSSRHAVEDDHGPLLIVYDDSYLHLLRGFPSDHPLRPIMGGLAIGLMQAYGLLDDPLVVVQGPRLATDAELTRVHDAGYVARVRELSVLAESRGTGFELQDVSYGLVPPDNPVFPGLHDAAATIAGGTTTAMLEVMAGRAAHAFVPLAGMHHAKKARAHGFCVYNDPAVAIAAVRAEYPQARVAAIDLDAHHGDGVQALFWDDPQVLAISMHESGRYLFPGTGTVDDLGGGPGYGYTVNVPLEPFTDDETYARAFAAVVPPLLRAYRPDIILAQLGVDTHWTDPLTEMATTTNLCAPLASTLHGLAHDLCEGRLVGIGGGSYQPFSVAPRAWTLHVAAFLERERDLPDAIPEAWVGAVSALSHAAPRFLSDPPAPTVPTNQQLAITAATNRVLERIRAEVFPLHGMT